MRLNDRNDGTTKIVGKVSTPLSLQSDTNTHVSILVTPPLVAHVEQSTKSLKV